MIKLDLYPHGKKKALTMSYDDGQIHDRRLIDIFNKCGIKGTFHLNSGICDKEEFISLSEIASLYKGHEVSVHTVSHPWLNKSPKEMILQEIMEDRVKLESLTGYPVRGMSYPFGAYDERVLEVLTSLGIEYSRTTRSTKSFGLPENFLEWHPTCHHRENILDRAKEFIDNKNASLFYVWGHSYEFHRNNNWEIIEDFCKFVADKEDIWYATNIEIVDYINAVRNLKFSARSNLVYNPSAISVWFTVDGNPIEVRPGQTLEINQ